MSGSSPRLVMDQRYGMNQAIDDLFNADSSMEYFTIPVDKDDMSPILDTLDNSHRNHPESDLYNMVDDYEHHFHVSHPGHSISLSLTPAATSFDLMDQNEKWQAISSHTREVRLTGNRKICDARQLTFYLTYCDFKVDTSYFASYHAIGNV